MKGLAQMWLSVKDQPARRLCRFGQRLWRQWRVTIFVILSFDITDKYQPRLHRFLSRLR